MAGDEDPKERLDRKLDQMLQELRVALPGIQVLFAFLLTVPFTNRFADLTDTQRAVYFGAFLTAAGASLLLIGTTAYHRLRWTPGAKESYEGKRQMLLTANRLSNGGLILLAMSMGGVIHLIADVMFNATAAGILAGIFAAAAAWFWFALPLSRRARDSGADRQPMDEDEDPTASRR